MFRSVPLASVVLLSIFFSLPVLGEAKPGHLTLTGELREVWRGDVNGDSLCDLVAACVEKSPAGDKRTFQLFLQKKGAGFPPSPSRVLPVPGGAAAATLASVGGTPALDLLWLDRDGVYAALDPGTSEQLKIVKLLGVRTFFRMAPPGKIARLSFARDLNGDGRVDLCVPQEKGLLVAYQSDKGKFSTLNAVRIPGSSKILKHTNPVFETHFLALKKSLPLPVAADFDGDGRLDLCALKKPDLFVFLQHPERGFPPDPSIRARLPFLSRASGGAEMDLFERKVVRITDVNRDRCADLVYISTHGKVGLFSSIKTSYALFLGRKKSFFPEQPDRLLNIPGIALVPTLSDYDGDGDLDLLVASVRTDLFQGIKTAVVKEVTLTNFLFLTRSDGLWCPAPAFEEEVSFSTDKIDKGELAPRALFTGDFNGDGRCDKVTVEGEKSLAVFSGRLAGERYRFGEKPFLRLTADVSADLEVADLDGDGRSDILFYHPERIVVVLSGGRR